MNKIDRIKEMIDEKTLIVEEDDFIVVKVDGYIDWLTPVKKANLTRIRDYIAKLLSTENHIYEKRYKEIQKQIDFILKCIDSPVHLNINDVVEKYSKNTIIHDELRLLFVAMKYDIDYGTRFYNTDVALDLALKLEMHDRLAEGLGNKILVALDEKMRKDPSPGKLLDHWEKIKENINGVEALSDPEHDIVGYRCDQLLEVVKVLLHKEYDASI